jgi:hypothetical protein
MQKEELAPRQLLLKFLCRAKPTLRHILSRLRFRHDSASTCLYFMWLPAESAVPFVDSVK